MATLVIFERNRFMNRLENGNIAVGAPNSIQRKIAESNIQWQEIPSDFFNQMVKTIEEYQDSCLSDGRHCDPQTLAELIIVESKYHLPGVCKYSEFFKKL